VQRHLAALEAVHGATASARAAVEAAGGALTVTKPEPAPAEA
jgi:ribosomal protein L15